MKQAAKRSQRNAKIAKSWADINQHMGQESDFQRQQREASAKVERAESLKQQAARAITGDTPGGITPRHK